MRAGQNDVGYAVKEVEGARETVAPCELFGELRPAETYVLTVFSPPAQMLTLMLEETEDIVHSKRFCGSRWTSYRRVRYRVVKPAARLIGRTS
jgi:hypothetical protein